MPASILQDIDETITTLFGTMFFIALAPHEEIPPRAEWDADDVYIRSGVQVKTGSGEQAFSIYFTDKLAREITANFLGIDGSELNDENLFDTMRETANMTVGGLLGRIDPKGTCSLEIPTAEKISGFSPAKLLQEKALVRAYQADSSMLWISCSSMEACDSR